GGGQTHTPIAKRRQTGGGAATGLGAGGAGHFVRNGTTPKKKFVAPATRLVAQCRACYGCISEGRSDTSHFSTAYLRLMRNPWRRIVARCRYGRCAPLR